MADLSTSGNPWVLRYAGRNARFPSETILIRMRGMGRLETERERKREKLAREDLLLDYRTFYLIT